MASSRDGKGDVASPGAEDVTLTDLEAVHWLAQMGLRFVCEVQNENGSEADRGDTRAQTREECPDSVELGDTEAAGVASHWLTFLLADATELRGQSTLLIEAEPAEFGTAPKYSDPAVDAEHALAALESGTWLEIGFVDQWHVEAWEELGDEPDWWSGAAGYQPIHYGPPIVEDHRFRIWSETVNFTLPLENEGTAEVNVVLWRFGTEEGAVAIGAPNDVEVIVAANKGTYKSVKNIANHTLKRGEGRAARLRHVRNSRHLQHHGKTDNTRHYGRTLAEGYRKERSKGAYGQKAAEKYANRHRDDLNAVLKWNGEKKK